MFNMGGMGKPSYALGVFRRHFQDAVFGRKDKPFVALELGPGVSVSSLIIARAFGASSAYAVDVASIAVDRVEGYRQLESYLCESGLIPPSLLHCSNFADVLKACDGHYLTNSIESLRGIPSASVDFIFSHPVLQHIRRKDFVPLLRELRRIQRIDGVGSHTISITDILGGNLNDLRFSEETWESEFMASSGFYTNRIRYSEFLNYFEAAGFLPQIYRIARWKSLPTPRNKMAREFAQLPDSDLQVSGFDVYLH
jgi:SAM-dependent methyltransferase